LFPVQIQLFVVKVKEVRVSSLFGRVVRESPRKRKLATYGEAEVTSILFAEEEKAPPAAPASQPCSKKPRQYPLLRSISDPVPSICLAANPDIDPNPDLGFAIILKVKYISSSFYQFQFLYLVKYDTMLEIGKYHVRRF
jgi:hypothetical protein